MKLLIDTHAIIWYFRGDTKLTERAFSEIEDPFDRLLVSQCINQKLSILSKDKQFDKYGEFRIW